MSGVTTEREEVSVEGFATVSQGARYLAVSRSTVYSLMDRGELKYAKIGKSRRIPWRVLREFGERCLVQAD
jgi:excisionase family DNA binding protein